MVTTKLAFNTFVYNNEQVDLLKSTSIQELLIEHKDLSRFGKLNTQQTKDLIEYTYQQGFAPILQWDILGDDQEINRGHNLLKQLPLSNLSAIRVQDVGIAEFIIQNFPNIEIHLIVETGNHNITGLQQWAHYFKLKLKRLVLSTELPSNKIRQYCEQLSVPCEILGLGRILLFYTPRKLLRPLFQTADPIIEHLATSDEQKHHYFPTLENQHGTFMFHYYDLFLLDLLPELLKTKLHSVRLDLRFYKDFDWITKIDTLKDVYDSNIVKTLRSQWPVNTTHGFFRANRTDRPIDRLKNKYLRDHGENLVAYVVESLKGKHIALNSKKPFRVNETLLFITPEGKEVQISPRSIYDTQGNLFESATSSGIWLIPFHKWIVPKTLVYRISDSSSQ